jgi:lipid II:glycine glycyltransferase (peptidoglycan interpeptide bridge formation enzyme)
MFSDDYFAQLRDRLKGYVHLCSIMSPDNDLSAAAVFTTCGDIIQYHLGGTSPYYIKEAPSKLIFDAIRTWGKAAGYRYFHLGGGLGASQDSLFHFKAGFSAERRDFFTYRLIIDELKYQACLDSWQKLQPDDSYSAGDFFPGYRRA